MGKGRTRVVSGQNLGASSTVKSGVLNIPSAPVYYPTEEEFKDPLEYVYKIRPEAEPYGICKIVPPKGWKPPFALDLDAFTFPTKTQAIHQLQARPAACDSKTFELEYGRFLEEHCGKKLKKVSFEDEELDLCKLFNAVKRFGGYDKVVKEKKWGEAFKFLKPNKKISECSKHVLCQLYRSHLYDYETYYNKLNKEPLKGCKRRLNEEVKGECRVEISSAKRRRRNNSDCERVRVHDNVVKAEEELDQICEQCRSGLHGEVMLLCDRCNKGWHIYCLSPPLKQVPPGNWYCLDCLNSDKDSFGFVPGKQLSLESFRRVADRAKKKWFGSGLPSRVHMEKKFWEIVEGLAGRVEVMYGSDLDTSVYGSGFPRVNDLRPESIDANVWDKYCASPWNLNNLPKLKGSMLQTVHHNITGVMVPWLYVGMLFSAFCWHFEDHCFYSMNYHHWGEPKCWYSVPGNEANAFEKVMRNSLPDLFDAQPDLLFQLVTMLNPSVLQENGVPVYTILQEPGNFVITFPRSYHAGFNFGLNCAEAVNFAPADWLPHGGFGAKLYQLYRKAPVLSHEELLCVAAKSGCDSKASPYLKKELLRICTKERTWREKLWRKGIIRSRLMCPRKCPDYVGTEEDPTCIICQQYLYLSAVVCRCRPSTYVCLEHWEHLCECKSRKHRLLYRHTVAELHAMLLTIDKDCSEEVSLNSNSRRQLPCTNQPSALTKKVKGGRLMLSQLAEEWLQRSHEIYQNQFSSDAYTILLREAEQFLWGGSEMDPVRHMVRKLLEAQRWAKGIRNSIAKIENWSNHEGSSVDKVRLRDVEELWDFDPVPFSEPGHLKLKSCAEEASLLRQEINAALSKWSEISELEALYTRSCGLPIYIEESDSLSQRISSAKVWLENVKKCISGVCPAAYDIDTLYQLKSEILDLHVQCPETEIISNLVEKAEAYRAKCSQMLNGLINLKNVETLLEELNGFTITVPELMLLKQYHGEAISWIARFNNIMANIHERTDQHTVIDELDCIIRDGTSLKIQVDELSLVEVELKKAHCRAKAYKACDTKMSLDFIQEIMADAAVLHIDKEALFLNMSEVLHAGIHWEERARTTLACKTQMSEFEDLVRTSEDIFAVLPSLVDIQEAVSFTKSWLKDSKPFLASASLLETASGSLNLEALKGLVSQSKFLKISMEECCILESILQNCNDWQSNASSLLQDFERVLDTTGVNAEMKDGLMSTIDHLIISIGSARNDGLSLGFHFHEISQLDNSCSVLSWCKRALSFCYFAPSFEDVKSLMEDAENLSISCASSTLLKSLYCGVQWLRSASEVIFISSKLKRCKLSDVEEVLTGYQDLNVSFPAMVGELTSAIQEHKQWQERVFQFFNLKGEKRSWSLLLQLKENGEAAAFQCSELEMVLSQVDKIENWKQLCMDIVGESAGNVHPLLGSLQKLKQSVDRSLNIYDQSMGFSPLNLCVCCASGLEGQEALTCSTCNDCYHLRCLRPVVPEVYVCHYCQLLERGSISHEDSPLKFGGKCSELRKLIELLSNSENFCVGIEERSVLQSIVDGALACKTFLTDILKFAFYYMDKDLNVISSKLTTALKAIEVTGVYDHQSNRALELALARHSWRLKVDKLLVGSSKPSLLQIQHCLTEGLVMKISPEDYFRQILTELNQNCLQWSDQAKKITTDCGSSSLDKVFELITEGEALPVSMEKELTLLRARSMLYCICRKPYDGKAMVACDQCDEWYHMACLGLRSSPKLFICAACKPETDELLSTSTMMDEERSSPKFVEPKTPSPTHTKPRKKEKKVVPSITQKMLAFTNSSRIFNYSSGIDVLWWRNRKPFRRAARKRAVLENFSPFIHRQ